MSKDPKNECLRRKNRDDALKMASGVGALHLSRGLAKVGVGAGAADQ
jgi:hypothetical protein